MVKIGIVMPGHHVLLEDFCEQLTKEGFEVTLLLPKGDVPQRKRSFQIREYGTLGRSRGYPIPLGLNRLLNGMHFDLVVTGEDFVAPTWVCALNSLLTHRALVLIQEKYFVSRKSLMAPFHRLMLRTVCPLVWRASRKIIAHSRAAVEFLVENGATCEKIAYLPIGVDANKFSPAPSREKDDGVSLLSVARLTDHKGLEYVIDAVSILRDRGIGVTLRIVGDGPLRERLSILSRSKGVEDLVVMTLHVDYDDMPDVYRSADVFVLASVVEVFGVSVLEAMACGLPVVVTDIGGLPDLPSEGENGFIVEPRDPAALADAVERIMDHGQIEKMGRKSREIVLEKFEWVKVARSYGDIFRNVIRS